MWISVWSPVGIQHIWATKGSPSRDLLGDKLERNEPEKVTFQEVCILFESLSNANNSTTESRIANLLSGEGSSKEVFSQSEIMAAVKFLVVSLVIF